MHRASQSLLRRRLPTVRALTACSGAASNGGQTNNKLPFDPTFENTEEAFRVKSVVSKMRKYGVKAILDYSVEKDVSEETEETTVSSEDLKTIETGKQKEQEVRDKLSAMMPDAQSGVEPERVASDRVLDEHGMLAKQYTGYQELWDRRKGVSSARTYFYESEPECDENARIFRESIDSVAAATEGTGFVAVKLTALGRPMFLIKLSEVIARSQQFYRALSGTDYDTMLESNITRDQFLEKLNELGIRTNSKEVTRFFDRIDFDADGFVDLYQWSRLLDHSFKMGDLFKILNLRTAKLEPLIESLSDHEEQQFANMMRRLRSIVEHAQEKGVRVMIDAEQTYFQPAISRLTVEMMRRYNKDQCTVFNTYQAYLRRCYSTVHVDMMLARREDFYFGCKLVRGAYMEQERARAKLIGYRDPINATFDETTNMYNRVFKQILDEVRRREPGKVSVMCATHNEEAIRGCVELMRDTGIGPDKKVVCFGQLYGMCDQVSFTLGQAGYSVYKYVPYGPVEEVLPYLSRRALENSGFIKKALKERRLMAAEVRRRLLPFNTPPTPQKSAQPVV